MLPSTKRLIYHTVNISRQPKHRTIVRAANNGDTPVQDGRKAAICARVTACVA